MVAVSTLADSRRLRTGAVCTCLVSGFEWVGYASGQAGRSALRRRGLRVEDLENPGCELPVLMLCKQCEGARLGSCRTSKSSQCLPCAGRHKRRLSVLVESGISRRLGTGFTYLLTLTAPGSSRHYRGGRVCPCTPVGGVDLGEWNAASGMYWNRLRTWIKDTYGPEVQYFRGVEIQARGAIHFHIPLWSPVPLDHFEVQAAAIRAGFGHEVDLERVDASSKRVARYVAKYVTKTADVRDSVPWAADVVDLDTGEISRGLVPAKYRGYSKSSRWGVTMREVKAAAREWALVAASAGDPGVELVRLGLGGVVLAVTGDP